MLKGIMDDPRIKPCCVILEPCTPKGQVGLSAELRRTIQEKNILTSRTRKKILSDLDKINERNVEKDHQKRRQQAVEEILTSEISYLHHLELIKDYFMKPIKERGILTDDEFQTLFGSIRTIYNISSELLRELKKGQENIAKAFSNIAPFFKLYSVYAYDYKKSLSILQKAPSNNDAFCKFLELQESRPEVQKKLSALLITPIQRVPRYRLLLKQVLEHTSSSHPSYSLLIESLKKVEKAATHINNLVEEQENTQRLLELQRSLQNNYPSIIKPDRKLIKEGILMKLSQNGTQSYKRYFVLMSDIIMYCKLKKENPHSANSLKCSCILPLNKCNITENLSKGAFKITCQEETIALYHEHAEESKQWVETLTEAIKKYLNNRRTLRKDSSSRRPVYKKHIGEYQDLGVSPGRPRKKRILDDKEYEDIFKNISNDSEDSDGGTTTCFSIKATKRKPIRDYDRDWYSPAKIPKHNPKSQDILFPLREHFLQETSPDGAGNECNKSVGEPLQNEQTDVEQSHSAASNNEVFVFGNGAQQPRGFRFNMGTILTGLGNSFKRMFGFGDNHS